jgi:hypothetical protein
MLAGVIVESLFSSAVPNRAWHPTPNGHERRIDGSRSENCRIGRCDHAADACGESPADQTGCERQYGMPR